MVMILVTGNEDSGKDNILELVLKRAKHVFPKYKFIDFKDMIEPVVVKDLNQLKKTQASFYRKLEKMVVQDIKLGKHVIVSGYLTIKVKDGFYPIIPEDFFRVFGPDVMVNVELDNPGTKTITHQVVNRHYAAMYSSMSKSLLKVLKVDKRNIRTALKEMIDVLEFAFK